MKTIPYFCIYFNFKKGNNMKLNMQGMLSQVQKMQSEMERIRKELDQKTITAESGGGMVQVTITGGNHVVSIKLTPEIVNPDDIEMLEDLIVAAINKAVKGASEMVSSEMGQLGSMMPNIPGLNLNL
ncbi:MAG: nucleoid-associated protein EbfC [Bacteroidota bacterium]|nr:nucleoid-associated protein EbfC [Bacteroidota bacterium]